MTGAPVPIGRARRSRLVPIALLALGIGQGQAQDAGSAGGEIARGARLAALGNCAYCHGAPDAEAKGADRPLSGGRRIETWYGHAIAPNITPDPSTGIGRWTLDDFRRALRAGIGPDGLRYQGVFPTEAYGRMSDGDIAALFAWLMAQPPVTRPNQAEPHRPDATLIGRLLDRWPLARDPAAGSPLDPADTGAYLVAAIAHCDQCHQPRDAWGRPDRGAGPAGSRRPLYGGGRAPNLTPDLKTGIGAWTEAEIATYLETGDTPDYESAKGSMAAFIHGGLRALTRDERLAIARHLKSLPARAATP